METAEAKLLDIAEPKELDVEKDIKYPKNTWQVGKITSELQGNTSPWEGKEDFATEAKLLGRKVSRKIPKEYYQKICEEYSTLTDKMFAEDLTRKEEVRRIYLKWTKDRLEDAYYGEQLDYLEALIDVQDNISNEIKKLVREIGR